MRRSKRMAIAAGILGLAAPAMIHAFGAPSWLILAAVILMIAGAATLAVALPVPLLGGKKKESAGQKTEEETPKKEESPQDEPPPLTTELLLSLMPGKTELSEKDREELRTICRAGWKRIEEQRKNRKKLPHRTPEEMRARLLLACNLPISAPTPPEDREAVPITIFSNGKIDPEKLEYQKKKKELETIFSPYNSGDSRRDQLARCRDSFLKLIEKIENASSKEKEHPMSENPVVMDKTPESHVFFWRGAFKRARDPLPPSFCRLAAKKHRDRANRRKQKKAPPFPQ